MDTTRLHRALEQPISRPRLLKVGAVAWLLSALGEVALALTADLGLASIAIMLAKLCSPLAFFGIAGRRATILGATVAAWRFALVSLPFLVTARAPGLYLIAHGVIPEVAFAALMVAFARVSLMSLATSLAWGATAASRVAALGFDSRPLWQVHLAATVLASALTGWYLLLRTRAERAPVARWSRGPRRRPRESRRVSGAPAERHP